MTLRYDLQIRQGETWSCAVPVLDASNNPVTLTGYTAKAQIRDGYTAASTLHEWTAAAGNLTIGSGQITLAVPAATSATWTWRLARWALEITNPGGNTTRLVEGSVLVDPEITR